MMPHECVPVLPLLSTDGNRVVTWPPPAPLRWFHGKISRSAAESVLLNCPYEGAYLFRESESSPGPLAVAAPSVVQSIYFSWFFSPAPLSLQASSPSPSGKSRLSFVTDHRRMACSPGFCSVHNRSGVHVQHFKILRDDIGKVCLQRLRPWHRALRRLTRGAARSTFCGWSSSTRSTS